MENDFKEIDEGKKDNQEEMWTYQEDGSRNNA